MAEREDRAERDARAGRDAPMEFTSELGAAPAAPPEVADPEMEPADDPEGYVGPDGLAAPHERPGQVRESYDDVLDRLPTVSLDDVEELAGNDRMQGPDADAATG